MWVNVGYMQVRNNRVAKTRKAGSLLSCQVVSSGLRGCINNLGLVSIGRTYLCSHSISNLLNGPSVLLV